MKNSLFTSKMLGLIYFIKNTFCYPIDTSVIYKNDINKEVNTLPLQYKILITVTLISLILLTYYLYKRYKKLKREKEYNLDEYIKLTSDDFSI